MNKQPLNCAGEAIKLATGIVKYHVPMKTAIIDFVSDSANSMQAAII